jgi:hypothetical protein
MINFAVGVGACVLTFLFAIGGMRLQKRLPEDHITAGAGAMIGAVMGLIALLLALVLGTLVGSAYGFFATQKANVELLAARSIQLDMALKPFGAEGQPLRAALRAAVEQAHKAIWIDDQDPRNADIGQMVAGYDRLNAAAAQLKPTTPEQTAALPTANVSIGIIEQTRLLMALQLASPISWPLLFVVVSWAMLLFACYGVMAKLNTTAVIAALIGAFSVGSAIFLILELNQPFNGLFRIPAAAVEETLAVLGK